MKNILSRTLEQSIRLWVAIAAVAVGVVGGLFLGQNYAYADVPAFATLSDSMIIMQSLIVFFLVAGVYLMSLIIANTTGLIASEVHDGTLRLLVAKPNNRTKILGAKLLGSVIGDVLLYLIALAAMMGTFVVTGHRDGNIVAVMLRYYPAYILYGLAVIVVMTGICVLLSCIAKRKVGAMLPMLVVMIAVLGFFPIFRSIGMLTGVTGSYAANRMYLYDINYHFATLFSACLDMCGGIKGSTNQLTTVAVLLNTFTSAPMDTDIASAEALNTGMSYMIRNHQVSTWAVTFLYLAAGAGGAIGSLSLFRKKDV